MLTSCALGGVRAFSVHCCQWLLHMRYAHAIPKYAQPIKAGKTEVNAELHACWSLWHGLFTNSVRVHGPTLSGMHDAVGGMGCLPTLCVRMGQRY